MWTKNVWTRGSRYMGGGSGVTQRFVVCLASHYHIFLLRLNRLLVPSTRTTLGTWCLTPALSLPDFSALRPN